MDSLSKSQLLILQQILILGTGCDFEPRPDYWVALLWRRLSGGVALHVSIAAFSMLMRISLSL